MFVLSCDIKIGKVSFTSVVDVQIKRSIHNLAATAVLKLPVTAVLKYAGTPPTYIETVNSIKVGDPVSIRLGYDNLQMETEFNGYVKQINEKKPLEIECEDEFYKVRSRPCKFNKEETTLKEYLTALFPDIRIGSCMDLTLKNVTLEPTNGADVLGKLKQQYGLTIFFDVDGRLYVGKADGYRSGEVKYRLRDNVIKDDDLKAVSAKDVKMKVKATGMLIDGSTEKSEVGTDEGAVKELTFYGVEDVAELKELAELELKRHCFDGYRGKLETFLAPYACPGMVAQLEDPVYKERNGSYYIESVDVSFGRNGARRKVEIGSKV